MTISPSKASVISGTFSEAKFIKTRSVMQIVIEVPIEAADDVFAALGGVPQPGREAHVAVARLNTREEPKPKGGSLAQQCGMLCGDPVFLAYLQEVYPQYGKPVNDFEAATVVRKMLNMESRAEIDTVPDKGIAWRQLKARFDAWKML